MKKTKVTLLFESTLSSAQLTLLQKHLMDFDFPYVGTLNIETIKVESIPEDLVFECSYDVDAITSFKELEEKQKFSWTLLKKLNKEATERGSLVGRFLKIPWADGYAIYQITEIYSDSCTVKVCEGFPDDWVVSDIGEEGVISIKRAITYLYM